MTNSSPPHFCLDSLLRVWPGNSTVIGAVLFGSRVKEENVSEDEDWDIGIVYRGERPFIDIPSNWDLYIWEDSHWEKGFIMQMELARYGKVLFDREGTIERRLQHLREKVLPHWVLYLDRL